MRPLRILLSRLQGLIGGRRLDEDLRRQIESHLEEGTEEHRRLGLSMADARRAALRSFGGVAQVEEAYREARSVAWMEHAWRDMRHGLRSIRRTPGFAAATIVTLALGIGANGAILSVVYAALLRPLPYAHPEQIFSVEVTIPERSDAASSLPVRIQDVLEWRRAETVFSEVAALSPTGWNLTGNGEPERVGGARVSANFFSFLGVPPAYGRGFLPEEEVPGQDRVVVISDGLWRGRYGADPTILNRGVLLNGNTYQVVGIAPASVLMPTGTTLHASLPFASRIDIWTPIAPTTTDLQGENWNYGLLVRLTDGDRAEQGRMQLQTLLNRSLRMAVPDLTTEFQTRLVPSREIYAGKLRLRLLLVFGAAGLLLLAACANVANLYLGRMASRSHEFALRVALGARRSRILAQVVTESTCLAFIGGGAGVALAYLGLGVLLARAPYDVRALVDTPPGMALLAVSILVSVSTGVACGLLPAWHAYRKNVRGVLQEGLRSGGPTGAATVRQTLVGVEMAVSTALLLFAALLLHSFANVASADRGYTVQHVLTVGLSPSGARYATPAQRTAFYEALLAEVRPLPDVTAVGAISNLPAVGESGTQAVFLSTDTDAPGLALHRPVAGVRSATPDYFIASGTRLRAGRVFSDEDVLPVAVISESLGRQLWPDATWLSMAGRTLRQGAVDAPDITVVGIAEDVRSAAVDRELPPQLYRPHRQTPNIRMSLLVRTARDPAALAGAVRDVVRRSDPGVPIPAMRTMQDIVSTSLDQRRFQMQLTVLFGVVGLVLGAVGVYGVVSYSVTSRTREIGLHLALGATPRKIIGSVVSRGMRPAGVGLALGLAGAATLAHVFRHLLFGIGALDLVSIGSVTFLLLSAAAVACYLPARRASRLDPIAALRRD